jgi:hypothetical protein
MARQFSALPLLSRDTHREGYVRAAYLKNTASGDIQKLSLPPAQPFLV